MSCGVGCRCGLDLAWLWHSRLAAAALISPLAWECPCAVDVALKSKKKKKASGVGTAVALVTAVVWV